MILSPDASIIIDALNTNAPGSMVYNEADGSLEVDLDLLFDGLMGCHPFLGRHTVPLGGAGDQGEGGTTSELQSQSE